jgi:hypothetical protein
MMMPREETMMNHRRRGMHDIDRTPFRYSQEMESYALASTSPALNEAEEMQLASELMGVQSEEEFENFLGDLISGITKAAGGFLNSSVGKSLGGFLKGAAKKLLPVAGTALGGFLGGPVGASLGGNLAGALGGALEMEAGEMEFEAARSFVRLAADAARNAAVSPQGETPEETARKAVADSALKNAPALIAPSLPPSPAPFAPASSPAAQSMAPRCPVCGTGHHHHHHHGSGRWIRNGNQIVLFGV